MIGRLRLLAAGVVVAAVLGACGSQASGPTGAPETGAPAAVGTGVAVLSITAQNIAFDRASYTTVANTSMTIHFDNRDQGVGHDVAIHQGPADGKLLFQGETIVGPATIDYHVPPLPPGSYTIVCVEHPDGMVATLTVK